MKTIGQSFGILFTIIIAFAAISALPAFSAPRHGDVTLQTLRKEMQATKVNISGKLICKMAISNDGSACSLKIQDSNSGRIYQLSNASDAMRMYQNGVINVRINGTYQNGSTIQVAGVDAL